MAPGQRVAIVGPTGCGKTTLINLLMRFYDVDEGEVCLENTDIRNLKREGRTDFLWNGASGYLASQRDGAGQHPHGPAGSHGGGSGGSGKEGTRPQLYPPPSSGIRYENRREWRKPSQGQKQLLCIARVMLCLPPMLILDEATSSIDTRTEIRIQKAFQTMMEGRTSFIVAHRLSTIRNADVILVMKDGNIIEQGTHRALLEKGGFYAQLYNSQFAGVQPVGKTEGRG